MWETEHPEQVEAGAYCLLHYQSIQVAHENEDSLQIIHFHTLAC